MVILLLDSKPKLLYSLFNDGDPGLSREGGIHYSFVCLADGTLARFIDEAGPDVFA